MVRTFNKHMHRLEMNGTALYLQVSSFLGKCLVEMFVGTWFINKACRRIICEHAWTKSRMNFKKLCFSISPQFVLFIGNQIWGTSSNWNSKFGKALDFLNYRLTSHVLVLERLSSNSYYPPDLVTCGILLARDCERES